MAFPPLEPTPNVPPPVSPDLEPIENDDPDEEGPPPDDDDPRDPGNVPQPEDIPPPV